MFFIIESKFFVRIRGLSCILLKCLSHCIKRIYLHNNLHFILKQQIYKISLKTMFLVLRLSLFFSSLMTCTLIDVRERTLEKATYSCPWLNTGWDRSNPNRSKVCPCGFVNCHSKCVSNGKLMST